MFSLILVFIIGLVLGSAVTALVYRRNHNRMDGYVDSAKKKVKGL